jgi:hypothetical protein
MRLPAKPGKQQRREDARELHELLWRAYQDPTLERVFILSAPDRAGRDLIRLSSNMHGFWIARGFRLRCKQNKDRTGFHVWLEAIVRKASPVEDQQGQVA